VAEPDGVALGVAHGTVEGVGQDPVDYPIARQAAARTGLDYLALGHWHSTATYDGADGAARMGYSGTHETTKFGERDSGNVLLVEIPERAAPPQVTSIHTGGMTWQTIEREIREPGDLARVRQEIEDLDSPGSTLVEVRLRGVLHPQDQAELRRLDELTAARFLFGCIDASALAPRPQDDDWLKTLPPGPLREAATRLQGWSDPAVAAGRPDYATPAVATRALLELYAMLNEVAG